MRAMIVDANTLSAMRLDDALSAAGFDVGRTRSFGEAFLLAQRELPNIAILSADLESRGVARRLADWLEQELGVPAVVANKDSGVLEHAACIDLATLALRRSRKWS